MIIRSLLTQEEQTRTYTSESLGCYIHNRVFTLILCKEILEIPKRSISLLRSIQIGTTDVSTHVNVHFSKAGSLTSKNLAASSHPLFPFPPFPLWMQNVNFSSGTP